MALSKRRIWTLGAVLVLACALVSGGGAASASSPGTSQQTAPTIYFVYALNCTFTIQNDAGQTVTAIAPGNYQIDVRTPLAFGTVPLIGLPAGDMTACHGMPQFQLTGPGVSISTTMTAGCESDKTFPATLQPSATYTAQDNNQPTVAHGSFTTLATGSPTSPGTTTGSGKGIPSTDYLGSGLKQVKGTLKGTVSPSGKPSLTLAGKPVSTLKPGRYTFAITDRDAKASFMLLGPTSKSTQAITGVKFVGKRSKNLVLKAGRWRFSTSAGQIHTFVVAK
ncbi:MAG TPA: hypothetical protein VH063_11470 [Gaiellaceae bacterium]|jgi:hypothetical protein|nr:hypothetical protein [Gaiellaceae bacterium]